MKLSIRSSIVIQDYRSQGRPGLNSLLTKVGIVCFSLDHGAP